MGYKRRKIPQAVKNHVRKRDKGRCVYCRQKEKLLGIWHLRPMEYGHVIPHSKRGDTCINNIQLECFNCNRSKSAKIVKLSWWKRWTRKEAQGCKRRCKRLEL